MIFFTPGMESAAPGWAAGASGGFSTWMSMTGGLASEEGFEGGLAVLVDLLGDGGILGLDFDEDGGKAVLSDGDVLDEAEGDDVPGKAGVFDLGEGGADLVGGHGMMQSVVGVGELFVVSY